MTVLTEVLPPPCKTSLGSPPSSRDVYTLSAKSRPTPVAGVVRDHPLCIRIRPQTLHYRHPLTQPAATCDASSRRMASGCSLPSSRGSSTRRLADGHRTAKELVLEFHHGLPSCTETARCDGLEID